MPMLRICTHPGCVTKTLGELCLQHERPADPAATIVRTVRDRPVKVAVTPVRSAT
jgi:hypothetical protein